MQNMVVAALLLTGTLHFDMEAMTDTSLVRVTIHIPGSNTPISSRVLSVTCPRTMLEIWALGELRSRFSDLREVGFRVIPVHPAVTWNAPILPLNKEKMVLIYEDVVLQLDAVVLLKLHLPPFYGEGAIYCPRRLRKKDLVTQLGLQIPCHRTGSAVVQDLINMWHRYVLFEEIFSALTTRASTPAQIIANLKKFIISGMVREAKSRLAIKIDREGWKGGIDHIWVDLVAGAPKRQCGGIARYTLLRWAVNQDDDVWLSMRGTRHQQKCVHCGLPNSAFPFGHQSPPMCENCIQVKQLTLWSTVPWSRPLLQAYTSDQSANQGQGLATVLGHHANI